MSNVFLVKCKQLPFLEAGPFVASLETFSSVFLLCGAFFTFANGH